MEELSEVLPIPIEILEDRKIKSFVKPLLIHFSDFFLPDKIKFLYANFKDISYVLHRSLVIDGIFIPSKGSPCHFCFFHRWLSLEKSVKNISETSWYNYYQYVSNESKSLPLSLPIERSDIALLVSMIKKKIRWLITGEILPMPFDPRVFTRYNLDNGTIDADLIPHCSRCGCLSECWQ